MRLSGPVVEILHFMLGVQDHGDHFVPAKPQEHPEMVVFTRLDFRLLDIRCVIHGVLVVIFKHTQHILEFRSGYEHDSGPVMNHSAWTRNGLAVVERFQLAYLYFAAFQRRVGLRALFPGESIDP